MTNNDDIRIRVKEGYGQAAHRSGEGCCGPSSDQRSSPETSGGCCGSSDQADDHALKIGYDEADLEAIPEEANLSLGCGNPAAIAELSEGETVLDLGSGAGMDAFLAAAKVGEAGHVIGVDMTPEMLGRARDTASRRGVNHFVEFRRGYIEDLPVTDESVDVILSNCVINLSPDKQKVFEEAWRVLKPGGRLAVSDICLSAPLPESIVELDAAYVACISGALVADDYEEAMRRAGFVNIEAERTDASALFDGSCSDPVVADAVNEVDPQDMEKLRDRLWSYRYTAEKQQ